MQRAEHSKNSVTEEKAAKDNTLVLAKLVYEKLLIMCNLGYGKEKKLPVIWAKLAEKGQETDNKKDKVRRHLEDTHYYSEAKVILFAPIVSMVVIKSFQGEVSRSSRRLAAKGLRLFLLPPAMQQLTRSMKPPRH